MTIFGTVDVLSFLVFAPAIGALIVLLLPKNQWIVRWVALAIATIIGGVSVAVFFAYNQAVPDFQFTVQTEWFQLLGSSWHIGIDGISAAMVLLTGLLTPLAVLVSFEVDDRVNAHMALILFFEAGLFGGTGQLVALDPATGTARWTRAFTSADYGAATVSHDVVFTSTLAGKLYGLSTKDGRLSGEATVGKTSDFTLVLSNDGTAPVEEIEMSGRAPRSRRTLSLNSSAV